jgi:DNA-binding GntR family transcriptional regulator
VPVPTPDHLSVERYSLRQIAVEKIKAAIFDHTLEPGEDLRDEDLQAWLGMSRTPVREALIELRRLGLVDMEAQRFTRVAVPDPTTALYDLQTLGALLGGLTRVTVPDLTPAATADILKALDSVDAALESGDEAQYLSCGRRLTRLLVENCPNPVLLAATDDVIGAKVHRLSQSRIEVNRDWDRLRMDYRNLRSAVEAGDPVGAELALERVFQLDAQLDAPLDAPHRGR